MNSRTRLFAVLFSFGFTGLILTGCASIRERSSGPSAYRPVGGKSLRLIELRDTVKSTRLALNRTTDSLNRIPGSPAAQQAYDAFAVALKDFNKLADETLQKSEDVRSRGRELFAEWSAETESIQDPEIRTIAEERRRTLNEDYNTMQTPLITARNDLNLVRSNLTDIQKALALDLTPAGIDAVKEAIDRINRNAATSVQSLDALSSQLDAIADTLPAPAAKKRTR
jgi:hypothetical protein